MEVLLLLACNLILKKLVRFFFKTSSFIVSCSDDHMILIFDITNGTLLRKLAGHEGGIWALQYWNNILVTGSTDRSVRIWDMETGECSHIFDGHTSTVRCLLILPPSELTPFLSRPLIITGSRDNTLRVWKLPDPKNVLVT
jgi:F-box and WD-40 domain protein CDC4